MILGATGISGLIAVAAARLLGAGRIVAAGRDRRMLARCKTLGANEVVDLGGRETLVEAMAAATHGGADVVIDYLNGGPAEAALETMATGGRMVQIGSLLAPAIRLNAGNARMRSLDVLGFAYYHAPQAEQAQAYARLCSHALAGEIEIATETYSLDDFPFAWDRQLRAPRARLVITP
jgi:NADPH2:quinone reductase